MERYRVPMYLAHSFIEDKAYEFRRLPAVCPLLFVALAHKLGHRVAPARIVKNARSVATINELQQFQTG
jgi:hypothetical protein